MADPISGKGGSVISGAAEVAHVRGWTFDRKIESKKYASSSTGGAKKTLDSTADSSGRFRCYRESGTGIPIDEGDEVTLQLHIDETGSNYYSVPARIITISETVAIEEGNPEEYEVTWEGNGVYTKNGTV